MTLTPDEIAQLPRAPYDDMLGLSLVEVGPDKVVATLTIDERHHQPYGIVHGGLYCSMAETAASIGAAVAQGEEGGGAVGQSNHTDFLRATREGTLTATATPVHVGRSVQLWQVDIADDEGRLVAQSKVRLFNVGVQRISGG